MMYNFQDFLNPPPPLLPYITTPEGHVVQFRSGKNTGGIHPKDVSVEFEYNACITDTISEAPV